MDFDDIVIGSGLAALGAVLGLLSGDERRVGVLCGPAGNEFLYYDERRSVPCSFLGQGGLGSHWHGVIPTGWHRNFGASTDASFAALFQRFYPHTAVKERLGSPAFFVPWSPIRPATELAKLAKTHAGRLTLIQDSALDLRFDGQGVRVATASADQRAARAWVAAGAMHTPVLLARSLVPRASRGVISDHVFCYVGQVDGHPRPDIVRTRDGLLFPAFYDANATALYSLRPATFAYRQLDFGIEQRAVFGLPTGSALAKIARRMSPGLLVEAFYNRFGLFAAAATHSVYAQVAVKEAYEVADGPIPLRANIEQIRAATDAARSASPFAGLRPSRRPELYLPGIHLHHSVDLPALAQAGVNQADSPIQVIDASVLTEIGPDHHSFKMLLSAYERARHSVAGTSAASPSNTETYQ